jgi:hypothetical protein
MPYCASCEAEVKAKKIDAGIGPYEYWGARGNNVQMMIVCDYCESSDLFVDSDMATEYTESNFREEE